MSWDKLRDTKLENDHVLLRQILPDDREQLRLTIFDPDIWRYFVFRVTTEAEFDQFMADAIDDTIAGRRLVFCVICKEDNRIAGSMCYGNLAVKESRLEIGWSWLGKEYRGKGINRWAKYLLMEYAFETLQCERVEFKTDVLNLQARKGLQNIGAKQEGVLRSYNVMPDKRRRDVVYYSILQSEWCQVKHALLSPSVQLKPTQPKLTT
jgi:RimJ/RimL family protein N-acetyltransferase